MLLVPDNKTDDQYKQWGRKDRYAVRTRCTPQSRHFLFGPDRATTRFWQKALWEFPEPPEDDYERSMLCVQIGRFG